MRRFLLHLALATSVWLAGCSRTDAAPTTADVLSRSLHVLDAIDADPSNTIPDAVLNAARCLIILPADSSRGPMTCRDQHEKWQAPVLVEPVIQHTGRLLIVMAPAAQRGILTGAQRTWSTLAGPLTRDAPLASDAQLKAGVLAYHWDGSEFVGAELGDVALHTVGADAAPKLTEGFLASVNSFADTILPTGLVIHHSGVVPSETVDERAVDLFHRERGFDVTCFGRDYHVAYHYLILPDGNVQQGRPERCEGAHARGYNSYLGIALVGDFSKEDNPRGQHGLTVPTKKQMDALIRLCRELRDHYRIPLQRVLRHSDIATTHCPGDRFPYQELMRALERP